MIIFLVLALFPTLAEAATPLVQNRPVMPVSTPALADESPAKRLEKLMLSRDPFKRPDTGIEYSIDSSDSLERYAVDSLRVIGILTGPDQLRALIEAPDGKTYTVQRGTKVGTAGGVIKQIYDDRILVQEKATNLAGKMELIQTQLLLSSEDAE